MHFSFAAALAAESADEPQWVHLLPSGDAAARDGRRWHGEPDAIVRRSLAWAASADLPIDFEHQTQRAATNGQPAPAAGWIETLDARPDGVWARVRWNDRAREMLRAREYRYISPAFSHTDKGEILTIFGAALTNIPALGLTALATAQPPPETGDRRMDFLKQIIALCGLDAAATPEQAQAHVESLVAARGHLTGLCAALDVRVPDPVDSKAQTEAILALAKAAPGTPDPAPPDPRQFVPRAEIDRLATQLASLQSAQATATATAAVDDAVANGKIAPAAREWALGYARKDPDGFAAYCAMVPTIVAPGATGPAGVPAQGADTLTGTERSVCSQMGLDAKAFTDARARMGTQEAA